MKASRKPTCSRCESLFKVGPPGSETYYCNGYNRKRKRRVPNKSFDRKVPDWCPRRIDPPACRIYGFVNENTAFLEYALNRVRYKSRTDTAFPIGYRYKLKECHPLNMTAKQFWQSIRAERFSSVCPDLSLSFGEVIEIDDGFKPYYFYYVRDDMVLTAYFDTSKTRSQSPEESRGEQI